ncbi:MAG: c-type cytochrome [Nitrospinota bacterium]
MPNFNFSEDEAVSVTAFLLSQTSENLKPLKRAGKGDPKKGKKLIKKVGCLGCHPISGEGETFASDLGKLGTKVNKNWLVNWILDPKFYAPKTLMPKFRLTIKEANDIAAYLMILGTPPAKFKYEDELTSPERIKKGKEIVQARGCVGCHDINGVAPGRVGPGLSKLGAKDSHHLDFGDNHDLEHTWESWVQNKIKDPSVYDTAEIKANMPTFNLTQEEIVALSVFLKGFDRSSVPSTFIQKLSVKEFEIEQGRQIVEKYNCRGCHIIEGKGGHIARFYKGKFNAPPPLETPTLHVGERFKDDWLYSFLRNPTPARKWLKVRMPTFPFTQEEIYYLTKMFVNFGKDHLPYQEGIREGVSNKVLIEGRKLVLAFECLECHDGSRGPTFDVVNSRIRSEWAKEWLRNTKTIFPGTKMPEHWPVKNGKRVIASKFSRARNMLGGDPEAQINTIVTYLENYDKKPFLNVELPEEDEDDEEDW